MGHNPGMAGCSDSFDVVIVGSSPLSLLESVLSAENGKRVCIVEMESRLGGAWKTEDCLGLTCIETSPHIFIPHGRTYALSDAKLESNFRTIPIQPVLHVRRSTALFRNSTISLHNRLRYDLAIALASNWDRLDKNRLWRARQLGKHLLASVAQVSSNIGSEAKYPEGGLTRWFERVENLLRLLGTEIRFERRVDEIRFIDGRALLVTADEEKITGDQVVLNKHVFLKAVSAEQTPIELHQNLSKSDHFTYVVKGMAPQGFVQFAGETTLMLANDVSDYIPNLERVYPGARVITARAQDNTLRSETLSEICFNELKSINYVPKDAELVAVHHRKLVTSKMRRSTIREIEKAGGQSVKFLLADDLGIMNSMARRFGAADDGRTNMLERFSAGRRQAKQASRN